MTEQNRKAASVKAAKQNTNRTAPHPGTKEREAALSVLLSVFEKGEYLDRALEADFSLSPKERAFLLRLCEGCVERRITLDYVLDRTASVPVKKQKPVIRTLLRMGAYQILFMDQVSDAAAVNGTVALVRGPFSSLKGAVNGILRSVARKRDEWLEIIETAPEDVRASVPAWIMDLWKRERGEAAASQMTEALLAGSPVCIRVNETRTSVEALRTLLEAEGYRCSPADDLPALFLPQAGKLFETQAYKDGLFYVQDAAAMQVIHQALLTADPAPRRVLDLCAAPGGKALQLAEGIAASGGRVTARDKTEEKVRRIKENAMRLGTDNLTAETADALVPDAGAAGGYDLVLCDLPCSGLGVLSRKPDIRYRITSKDIESLAALQRQMLHVAAEYVAEGGYLVYSTCTVSRAENEDNAIWFVRNHPAFEKRKEDQILPLAAKHDGAYYCIFQRK